MTMTTDQSDDQEPSRLADEQHPTDVELLSGDRLNESQQSPGIASNWSNQTTPIPIRIGL